MIARLKRTLPVALLAMGIAALSPSAMGQKKSATQGYFPLCFAGDVFSGVLTAADDSKSEITLTYTDPKDNTVQTFIGEIEQGYTVMRTTGPRHQLQPSELRLGKMLTVYYCSVQRKADGKKTKVHSVFFIEGVPNLATSEKYFMAF